MMKCFMPVINFLSKKKPNKEADDEEYEILLKTKPTGAEGDDYSKEPKKKKEVDDDDQNHRDWCNLPESILVSILRRLPYTDQARFRRVCKDWRLVPRVTSDCYRLPWLLSFDSRRRSYESRPECVNIHNLGSREGSSYPFKSIRVKHMSKYCHIHNDSPFVFNKQCTSRTLAVTSGWSLLLWKTADVPVGDACYCVFLYNPFSKENINLPKFSPTIFDKYALSNSYFLNDLFKFTLTYYPKCRRFAVYGAVLSKDGKGRSPNSRLITVVTWRTGSKVWVTKTLRLPRCCNSHKCDGSIFALKCIKGTPYCIFKCGTVGAFRYGPSIKQYYWSLIANSEKISEFINGYYDYDYCRVRQVVVCEEDLFLVVYIGPHHWIIFRLDWTQKTWVKEDYLGNRVLFLGSYGDSALMLSVGEQDKELAGRIYYLNDSSCNYVPYNAAESSKSPAAGHIYLPHNHQRQSYWLAEDSTMV
ncbi:F-box domain containing protein [Trema orientale]|uniref:F-box domain containing protein n=1 Tax=Trema orientale TaxID=63057 RepID=A0A2P5C6A0_TREOI|nr:F-box domain containing protein [Trema orientale]